MVVNAARVYTFTQKCSTKIDLTSLPIIVNIHYIILGVVYLILGVYKFIFAISVPVKLLLFFRWI